MSLKIPPFAVLSLCAGFGSYRWQLLVYLADAVQSLLQVVFGVGERDPDIPFAEFAERCARQHSHVCLAEQVVGVLTRRKPGVGDIRERVERALGLVASYARDVVQTLVDKLASACEG